MIPAISANLIRNKQNNNNALNSNYKPNSTKHSNTRTGNNNINNAYIAQKETELSTKNTSKDNYLDYTFISHRSQISNEKSRDVTKSKDYIFDLANTWELNVDLIESLLKDNESTEGFVEIKQVLQNIKQKFDKKKQLREEVSKIKGKILIEKQIIEELKRKSEENEEYYKDQIKEFEENRDNKEEYIKIFEKKLKEVEIYVQKNSKNANSKFEAYKDFKIGDFIEENTLLMKKREDLERELDQAMAQRAEVENENANYKQEMNNFSFTEDPNANEEVKVIGKNPLNEQSKIKLRQYYDFCKSQVRVLEMRNKLLRNYFKEMSSKLKYFNMDELKEKLRKERKQLRNKMIIPLNNKDVDGEEIEEDVNNRTVIEKDIGNDKSGLNLDITRKIATFMDFSVILNKKQSADDTNLEFGLNKTGLGNFADNLWDISCIGKN